MAQQWALPLAWEGEGVEPLDPGAEVWACGSARVENYFKMLGKLFRASRSRKVRRSRFELPAIWIVAIDPSPAGLVGVVGVNFAIHQLLRLIPVDTATALGAETICGNNLSSLLQEMFLQESQIEESIWTGFVRLVRLSSLAKTISLLIDNIVFHIAHSYWTVRLFLKVSSRD